MRQREQHLKAEVLREAQRFGGKVMLHGERSCEGELAAWGEVYAFWEPVDVANPKSVQTVDEVFADAQQAILNEAKTTVAAEGGGGNDAVLPHLELVRVPVMDERAPSPIDLDDVTKAVTGKLQGEPTSTSLFSSSSSSSSSKSTMPSSERRWVFNCQLGRGRTTTGMVTASMLLKAYARQQVRIALPTVRARDTAAAYKI